MKQKVLLSIALLCVMFLSGCDDKPVVPAQLPVEIQTFVKQTFPNQTISFATKDLEWFWYKYDVVLADGTKISFDTDNVWDKVETTMAPVPASLVPAPISTYVNTNFPNVAITKIDKERSGYDVDLANDLELKFNKQGALVDMDD